METFSQSISANADLTSPGWITPYNNYAEKADFNRIGWAATAIAIQGCILSPALLLTMSYFGGGDWQFMASMIGFLLVLIPILSALPVKYIFPTFAISILIHLTIILVNVW